MKWIVFSLLISGATASANIWPTHFMMDSHLRMWTASSVSRQFGSGANTVEIDFDQTQLNSEDLRAVMKDLSTTTQHFLILHYKKASITQGSQMVAFLNLYRNIHRQLLFYSDDSQLSDLIRQRFPEIYVARSTQEQINECLESGLEDESSFHANCLNADLWIFYSFFENSKSRESMIKLIEKIKASPQDQTTNRTRIAIDRISTREAACDVMTHLSSGIDGVITEDAEITFAIFLSPGECENKSVSRPNFRADNGRNFQRWKFGGLAN